MKNINVSIKLAVGIGAILLLIILLAASTLYNIDQVVMRGNNALQLSSIQDVSQDLIIGSDDYKLTKDEKHIQTVQMLIKDLRERSNTVKQTLTHERGISGINQVLAQTDSFEQAFAADIKAQKDQAANLAAAVNSGSEANALFDQIKTLVNGTAQ